MEEAAGDRDRVILNLNQPGPWSLALVQDLHTCLRAIEEEGVEEVWISSHVSPGICPDSAVHLGTPKPNQRVV